MRGNAAIYAVSQQDRTGFGQLPVVPRRLDERNCASDEDIGPKWHNEHTRAPAATRSTPAPAAAFVRFVHRAFPEKLALRR
jgi:hypothetical protein